MNTDELNDWTIGYFRNGQPKVITIQSANKPDLATIAISMRNDPGFGEFLIPDTLRGSPAEEREKAFFEHNGVPVEQITVDGPRGIAPYNDS
jgi:hypothetical protein